MSTPNRSQQLLTPNPFPGLRPFNIEESHLFFGREGQSDEVLLKLSKSRFVAVIGPSGSGKSSFIYCGVMPILYGGFLTDASPDWQVVVTRPGAGPIDNLAEALLKNTDEYETADPEEKRIKRTIFSTLLKSSSLGLVEAIEQSRKQKDINYLVLVDQFEELFRFKESHDANSVNETLAFVNLLIEAVNYPDAPIYVAITMRSDFIGDCAQFPELTRKINDSHYLIPQLTRDQKRKAIEGPVAVGGAQIAPRLTQQLLNDLGDNPDQLPILQHALMRTWSYWTEYKDYEEEPVDLKHYEAIGTMAEALSQHANEAFDELTEEQKRICEVMFKAITEKRGENFGIRRPTRLNEIAAIADVSEEDVIAVIEKFRQPGRSLLTPAHPTPLVSKSMVDISHESLMRIWVRLKNWVEDEAEAVQMYTRLAEAASMYQVGKAGLWRPPDLQLALNWQAKHKPTLVWGQRYNPAFERTMIFLEYSKKEWETEQRIKELEQKRKLKRARITALILASATVVSLIFLVFAFIQKSEADKQRDIALEQTKLAESRKELAEKNFQLAEEQRKVAEDKQREAEEARLREAEQRKQADQARLDAEQRRLQAEAAQKEAEIQEDRANRSADLALRREQEAKESEDRAVQAREVSQRLRYISIAKAMAIKSKELNNDPEQQSLLAQQAYNFNAHHKGYAYDNDIYNGLFYALRNQNHPLTKSLEGHLKGGARALETRRNHDFVYSGGSDGKIIQWRFTGNEWRALEIVPDRIHDTDRTNDYLVFTLDISPDEKLLAAGGLYSMNRNENYVELYDLTDLKAAPRKITGYKSDIGDIHFTPDGKGFYARDNSGQSIRYSDLNTAREVIAVKGKISALELSPDGTKLAGAGVNGKLFIWDIRNNYAESSISIPNASLTSVCYAPDSKALVVGTTSGQVLIVENGKISRTLSGHTAGITNIRFNYKGSFMATASKDWSVRLWNYKDLKQQPIVLSDHDWVWNLAFTPDDEQLIAGIQSVKETKIGQVDQTIHAWPTKIETMSGLLCSYLTRNISSDEWDIHVGSDLPYEITCPELPAGNK
ncbi:MAG TPA: High-affnity carbon uptake protein Hat/HatR [Chryseosolibacter sp.]|nr:High-affnity carbon uptake protein Hat/HatR [Chryseosolibacter sp.]